MAADVPPFNGFVETTEDALRLVLAARQGVIPRIHRRLNEDERGRMIMSGAVFVFSTDESGIKRWTDGYLWSPSRIVGNFLVYREILERAGGRGNRKSQEKNTLSDDASDSSHTPKLSSDHGILKPGGLIKKTITVVVDDSDHHLVAYYTQEDLDAGRLPRPSIRPDIMALHLPPHIFRLSSFRIPPKVSIGKDGNPYLVPENESGDSPRSPSSPTAMRNMKHEGDNDSYFSSRPPSSSAHSTGSSEGTSPSLHSEGSPTSHNFSHRMISNSYGAGSSRYQGAQIGPSTSLPSLAAWSPSPSPAPSLTGRRIYLRDRAATVGGFSNTNRWTDMPPPVGPMPTTSYPNPQRRHSRYGDRPIQTGSSYEYTYAQPINYHSGASHSRGSTVPRSSPTPQPSFPQRMDQWQPNQQQGSTQIATQSMAVALPAMPSSFDQALQQPSPSSYNQAAYFSDPHLQVNASESSPSSSSVPSATYALSSQSLRTSNVHPPPSESPPETQSQSSYGDLGDYSAAAPPY